MYKVDRIDNVYDTGGEHGSQAGEAAKSYQ
jgi:hypothetical protein